MMSYAGQAEKKLLKSLISTWAIPEERPRPMPKQH